MEVVFLGDTSFTGKFSSNILNGQEIFEPDLVNFFKDSDFCLVNLEGPCTSIESNRKDVKVTSPSLSIKYLKETGVTHANIANNHILDCGITGFKETLNLLKNNGIEPIGCSKNVGLNYQILNKDGLKIALIGSTQLFTNMPFNASDYIDIFDCSATKNLIKELKKSVDWIIFNYHGGEEYTVYPWPKRRAMLLNLFKHGVDLIICHHSHTVQPYEFIEKNKAIFYSLGNFVFDLNNHANKSYINDSIALKIIFTPSEFEFTFKQLKIVPNQGKVFTTDLPLKNFYNISNDTFNENKWYKDCARVFDERNRVLTDSSNSPKSSWDNKRSVKKKLKCLCVKVYVALSNPEFRAILFGTMVFKLMSFLGFRI